MQLIEKDILTVERGIIFHQVNCMGVMGGGIARAIALKWPKVESAYVAKCAMVSNQEKLLGRVLVCKADEELYVANVFGQNNVSRTTRQTDYNATVEAFETFQRAVECVHVDNIEILTAVEHGLYFPYTMGCGLGGGNWKIYSAIIEAHFPNAIICRHEV